MTGVVDHLAQLTGFRDRDLLDASLVGALMDLLQPQQAAVYRCVGEAGARRWFTRACLAAGQRAPSADPPWSEVESLPPLHEHPERLSCLLSERMVAVGGCPALSFFALGGEGQAVGVLELHTARPLADEQVRMVGSILRVYRNFEGLLDYSERDTLTGLLNRKTFDDSFLRLATPLDSLALAGVEQPAAGRRQGPVGSVWLGVIDIDHFKRVNDNHGHLIGDEVLLLLSRLMRSTFRYHDHLYRFGGEEFVALVRCESACQAAVAFERLRANVQGHAFPQVGHITVSVGFTRVRPGDSPSTAFDRADRAVYFAKQNGRNQVAAHAALVAAGRLQEAAARSDVELF